MWKRHVAIIVLVSLTTAPLAADTIHVPADYPTIQQAIDASTHGDEIIVAPGMHGGPINFIGKAVWLHSSDGPHVTTIDGAGRSSTVTCDHAEGPDTILEGFTITGGIGQTGGIDQNSLYGGGMYNEGSSPTVRECIFVANTARRGAGMASFEGDPIISNCTFIRNVAEYRGGAMVNDISSPTVTYCTFIANTAPLGGAIWTNNDYGTTSNCTFIGNEATEGGAIFNRSSTVDLLHCTLIGNSAERGGGMYIMNNPQTVTNCTFSKNVAVEGSAFYYSGDSRYPILSNCVFWNDGSEEIHVDNRGSGQLTVVYTDVRGGFEGTGNINADPLFVRTPDPGPDGEWGTDDDDLGDLTLLPGSPCTDAGVNGPVVVHDSDMAGNPRFTDDPDSADAGPWWPVVDMGAFEFQAPSGCGNAVCDGDEDCSSCAFDCGDCDDVLHVPDELPTIQSALIAALDGDEIVVAPGNYNEAFAFLGKAVHLRSAQGPDETTIDGAGLFSSIVTCDRGEGPDAILSGFKLRGGSGNGPVGRTSGGGMYVIGSSPAVIGCEFVDNRAHWGGGISIVNSSAKIIDCSFIANTGALGGGIRSGGSGSPSVLRCRFAVNRASSFGGGMIDLSRSGTDIAQCEFSRNAADRTGGGIQLSGPGRVNQCLFVENVGGYRGGGADVSFSGNDAAAFTRCKFRRNTAENGGGISLENGDSTIVFCDFLGNTATNDGGGINVRLSLQIVANCSLLGNTAGNNGGAVYLRNAANLINCTISGNQAVGSGGGVYDRDAEHSTFNSILWGNTPDQLAGRGGVVRYSNVEGGRSGEGNIDEDPLFVPDPNPGPDGEWGTADDDYGDVRLLPGSPSIDAADNDRVPADTFDLDEDGDSFEPLPFDLDLLPRFVDDPDTDDTGRCGNPCELPIVDMGAYEFQAAGGCVREPSWVCDGDVDGDGQVNPVDSGLVQAAFGSGDEQDLCNYDVDCDGQINPVDSGIVQSLFGTCQEPRPSCP